MSFIEKFRPRKYILDSSVLIHSCQTALSNYISHEICIKQNCLFATSYNTMKNLWSLEKTYNRWQNQSIFFKEPASWKHLTSIWFWNHSLQNRRLSVGWARGATTSAKRENSRGEKIEKALFFRRACCRASRSPNAQAPVVQAMKSWRVLVKFCVTQHLFQKCFTKCLTDLFDDVTQNCHFLCFPLKKKIISMNRCIVPNLVNLWRFRKILCKLSEIWEPKFANQFTKKWMPRRQPAIVQIIIISVQNGFRGSLQSK